MDKLTKLTHCDKCGRFCNIDESEMDVLNNGSIKIYCVKCGGIDENINYGRCNKNKRG